jgi:hypothetical protein
MLLISPQHNSNKCPDGDGAVRLWLDNFMANPPVFTSFRKNPTERIKKRLTENCQPPEDIRRSDQITSSLQPSLQPSLQVQQ